jgi:hypothetical protein
LYTRRAFQDCPPAHNRNVYGDYPATVTYRSSGSTSEAVVENAAVEELLDAALGCAAQTAVPGRELFLVDGHERLECSWTSR